MKRGPVDPDAIISEVLARTGKTGVDAGVLFDVAQALLQIRRPDLAAQYAARSYGLALVNKDPESAAKAMTLIVSELGADGRRALHDLK